MGATCSSHLIHFYISIPILSGGIITKALVSQISPSICFFLSRLSNLSPSVSFSKTSPFCAVPPGSCFPLLKRGFLLLSWNRFPGVQPFYLLALLDWSTVSMEICTRHLLTKHWKSCLWSKFRERDRLHLLTSQQSCISQASKSIYLSI